MILLLLILVTAASYQLVVLTAALWQLLRREAAAKSFPPVSILKPVRGVDPHFREAIRSHAAQDYPDFEIIFGVADLSDPAAEEVRRLIAEFPQRKIRLICSATRAANRKVGTLVDLAREAQYPLLLVNDGDIAVPAGYLRGIVGPLEDPNVGLVTCIYGASSDHWPGRWEALGISTDFAASVLAAPLVGVREFAMGATLLFRAADLRAMGGYEAVADYLADDYQLARHIARLGRRIVISKVTVDTFLSGHTWGEVWRHQVRWARTIRVSEFSGYAGQVLSNTTLWSVVALAAGAWWAAAPLLILRVSAGMLVGGAVLRNKDALRYFYLIPLRDLWGTAVWFCGLFGNTVEWRGARLRLSADGKINTIGIQGLRD